MKQYVVDAFTDQVFGGNPAAVCLLERWPADELLMKVTRENNLSETAFAVPEGDRIRMAGKAALYAISELFVEL